MACPLCEKRKPKRPCPARGDLICARCCGEQREVSIECPFDCSYLRESRNRDHKGIHPKHDILKYHQFFLSNVATTDTVLDLGAGHGDYLEPSD